MVTFQIGSQPYSLWCINYGQRDVYKRQHIDQPLSLQKMAGIACFSPFHFHRVFTILTGETPTDYIKRTRIEKAALLLKRNKELSATDVYKRQSLCCHCGYGYGNHLLHHPLHREYLSPPGKQDSACLLYTSRCV